MEKEIMARRTRMQELNSQAQDLVDAGHFDPNAVEETRIVMEERFVRIFLCNSTEQAPRDFVTNIPFRWRDCVVMRPVLWLVDIYAGKNTQATTNWCMVNTPLFFFQGRCHGCPIVREGRGARAHSWLLPVQQRRGRWRGEDVYTCLIWNTGLGLCHVRTRKLKIWC